MPPEDIPMATVEKYCQEHRMEFVQLPSVRASHVLVQAPSGMDPATKAAKKKIIDAARARVMKKEHKHPIGMG